MTNGEYIRDKVNSLIEKARHVEGINFGAVNWADLQVVDVREETSLLRPERYIYVDIEEACPTCLLTEWLTDELDEPGVIVRADW